MKKNLSKILLILVAVFVTSALVWALGPRRDINPSEYNIGVPYEVAMKDKKPFILMFYSDMCSYCHQVAPKFKMASEIYGDKFNYVMVDAEKPESQDLMRKYFLTGLPALYIIDPSIDNVIYINNPIYGNLKWLRIEFDRYLRIRAMIKP